MENIDCENYAWSTHQPLLHTVLEFFEPKFIVELGIGLYSTPIFSNYKSAQLVSIENDKEWIEYISKKLNLEYKIIFHDIGPDLDKTSFVKDMTQDQKRKIKDYYINFKNQYMYTYLSPKLLFVDNYTCCRTIAINTLYSSFDIIIYHDAEGVEWYEYYFDKDIKNKYNNYILKTDRSTTGCFIKKTFKYEEIDLQKNIWPHILKYCKDNNANLAATYLQKEL